MKLDQESELESWLAAATRGLSPDVSAIVRAEIEAHYLDALDEHRARGKTHHEAHMVAMRELGHTQETAQKLREVYLMQRRYLFASALSLVYPVMLIVTNFLPLSALTDTILLLSLLIPIVYILRTFKLLLNLRFDTQRADRAITYLLAGMSTWIDLQIASWVFFQMPNASSGLRPFSQSAPPLEMLLDVLSISGLFVSGVSLILLSDCLSQLKVSLFGLVKPLRFSTLCGGFAIMAYGLGLLLENFTIATSASLIIIPTGTIIHTLWTLIFFRAAMRDSTQPARIA